jgi:uncharacterized protein YqjF (DUF2071 family)
MTEYDRILNVTSHRPWPIPKMDWKFYQEWNKPFFLHWKVETKDIIGLIPEGITLDTFNNDAWISVVGFTTGNLRPKGLPAFPPISNFYELTFRTYVKDENRVGIYFFNIEAGKLLSVCLSKAITGMPYQKAKMQRLETVSEQNYLSNNKGKTFNLTYKIGHIISTKTKLDKWLTERYCIYLEQKKDLYRYEVHHIPWQLYTINITNLNTNQKIGNTSLNRQPDLAHYSEGVDTIGWPSERLIK